MTYFGVQGSVASVVSPPTTLSPAFTSIVARARQEQVDARSELHHAEALAALDTCSPSVSRQTMRRARMPTICRHDDGPPVVDRTRLRSTRSARRPRSCRRAGTCRDDTPRAYRARNRGPVDVDVHRRQEDADDLPLPAGAPGHGRLARDHHAAIGRRHARGWRRSADVRSGSRKKNRKNAPRTRNGTDQARPSQNPTADGDQRGPRG